MIACSAVQLRPSNLSGKRADFTYFNAVAVRFAKSQLTATLAFLSRLPTDQIGNCFGFEPQAFDPSFSTFLTVLFSPVH
jgi:hypothetical protein